MKTAPSINTQNYAQNIIKCSWFECPNLGMLCVQQNLSYTKWGILTACLKPNECLGKNEFY